MDTEKLSVEVHKAFVETVNERFKREEDENNRQNHRLSNLEKEVDEIHKINISIESMTKSIESLAREISRQGQKISDLSGKVDKMEKEPGEMWKKVTWVILAAVIGAVLAIVGSHIGLPL